MLVGNIVRSPQACCQNPTIVPSSSAGDFILDGGASMSGAPHDNATSGAMNIRTGDPGQVSTIKIGFGLVGGVIEKISMQFRYLAGYYGSGKAATVTIQVCDLENGTLIRNLSTTPPLGNYSWDHFTTYSPPVLVEADNLHLSVERAVILVLQVQNNQRNLQIPVDDLQAGFNVQVTWTNSSSSNNPKFKTVFDKTGGNPVSAPYGAGQIWAKKQPNSSMAVYMVNFQGDTIENHKLKFLDLNLTSQKKFDVYDIWTHKTILTGITNHLNMTVPGYDSSFIRITPSP
jgi:hypothetical protein